MQVDDRLAKEKLIRELDKYCTNRVPAEAAWIVRPMVALIRNTDLTDCQPQITPAMLKAGAKMYEDCLHSAADFEHHAFLVYCAMVDVIAPAPDQGSVRNATDKDAERYRWMRANWAYAHGNIFFDGFRLEPRDTLDDAIDAAIRALPDQKD